MLHIEKLNKSYGNFKALDDLDLHIERGELFGFVGPNGAGKTTTMRIVAGLLKADSGSVVLDDTDALRRPQLLKEKIGYMPDFFGVYDNLKVLEYMEFFASIYGIVGQEARQLCLDLMEVVNLADKGDFYVDSLSRGMKQRLCLARSLVHNPELLILDEPASGLDPRARFEMKGILHNLSDMGKTILISSHILPELAEMCTSIGIIEHGKMAVSGTVESIMNSMNQGNLLLIKVLENQDKAVRILKENPRITNLSMQESCISVGFTGTEGEEAGLLKNLIENEIIISSFARQEGNLESVFMQITETEEGGEAYV